MTDYNWRQLDIRIYAVIASLVISAFTMLVPDTPNDDAYVYIRTAEIVLSDGIFAAFQHYAWASYSLLIALVSSLGVSLFTAAYLVNALFFAVLVFAFVSIVKEIDDSRTLLVFAAISVLVYPQLNEYRYLIIRDIGFWSLSLLALWWFLLYTRSHSLKHGLGFCCSLLLAVSLRAEAIIYLLITPVTLLFDVRYARKECLRYFFTLLGMVISATVIALVLLAILGFDIGGLFVEFISVYEPFISSTLNPSDAEISRLGTTLFGDHAAAYSQEYVTVFIATGLLSILLANLFNAIGGPYLWILVYGFFQKQLRLDRSIAIPIISYLVVNAVILFAFLYITRYLTSRYAMLFCLLVALFVALVLSRAYEAGKARQKKLVVPFLALYLAYCAFDSYLSFGESKDFVFDSVDWISERGDNITGVVTNNHAIAYFSGKVENYDQILRYLTEYEIFAAAENDIVAIEMHYEMVQLVQSESIAPLLELQVSFPSVADQRIAIYRRINP